MTAPDLARLRAAAEACLCVEDWKEFHDRATPEVVIALLDRLAAAERDRDSFKHHWLDLDSRIATIRDEWEQERDEYIDTRDDAASDGSQGPESLVGEMVSPAVEPESPSTGLRPGNLASPNTARDDAPGTIRRRGSPPSAWPILEAERQRADEAEARLAELKLAYGKSFNENAEVRGLLDEEMTRATELEIELETSDSLRAQQSVELVELRALLDKELYDAKQRELAEQAESRATVLWIEVLRLHANLNHTSPEGKGTTCACSTGRILADTAATVPHAATEKL